MRNSKIARLACRPEDYTRLGLNPSVIVPQEDRLHTNGKFGEYEWWYFDAKLNDGWSLVIVFYSQPVTASCIGFSPSVTFALTKGNQEIRDSTVHKLDECFFDRTRCNVRLGKNYFEGDLKQYKIHFETQRITADITLNANASSWRPETGHFLFNEKKYFAWLPSVPEGTTEATIIVDDQPMFFRGTGYHDHNWGNLGMFWLMHHWYWGRAKVGEYQIISSYITAREKYGYEHFPIFLLLKNGQKIGDNPEFVTYTQEDPLFDPVTKKHFFQTLTYDYNDGTQHYRVTYRGKEIIEYFTVAHAKDSVQATAGPLLLWIVKKAKLDPSYIRIVGTVTLERWDGETLVEHEEAPGLWELMYFGMDEDV